MNSRASLLCSVIGLASIHLCAQATPSFAISTDTSFGLLFGQAYEEVYDQALSPDYKNSELVWPFEPMLYAGAGISLDTELGIFANLNLREGFAGKTGTMTDSDFLNGDGVKTHFSQSDSDLERAVLLDFKVGYKLPLGWPVRISAFLGFSYMDFKWSARDGYYQYPTSGQDFYLDPASGALVPGTWTPWSADETKTPIYGTNILYEQTILIGSLGLGASYTIAGPLTLDVACSFSPIVYGYAEDNHELRTVDFYSKLSNGLMAEPSIDLEYAIKPSASLKLALSYRWVASLKGDITQVDQGTTSTSSGGNYYAGPDSATTSANGSGASISMLDASLTFSLAF